MWGMQIQLLKSKTEKINEKNEQKLTNKYLNKICCSKKNQLQI